MANLEEVLSLLETEKIQKAMKNMKNQFHRSTPTASTKPNLVPFPVRNLLLEDSATETRSQEATVVIGNMTSSEATKEETTTTEAIEEVDRK